MQSKIICMSSHDAKQTYINFDEYIRQAFVVFQKCIGSRQLS